MRWQRSRLFYLEQWTTLFLGIACLAAFIWALMDGKEAFSSGQHSPLVQRALSGLGWLLSFAVALLGTALTRFAFYNPPPESGSEANATKVISLAKDSPKDATTKSGTSLPKAVAKMQGRS